MSKRFIATSVALAFTVVQAGCATIFNRTPSNVVITSSPDQAKVTIVDETGAPVFEGTTPADVTLTKKRGYFTHKSYKITVEKPGFPLQVHNLSMSMSPWYFLNLVLGGVIGMVIVDPLTGAMWSLATNELNVDLGEKRGAADEQTLRIVQLQDVPEALHGQLVRIK